MSMGSRIAVPLRLAVVAASLAATLLAAVHVHVHEHPAPTAGDACAVCRIGHAPALPSAPPAPPCLTVDVATLPPLLSPATALSLPRRSARAPPTTP